MAGFISGSEEMFSGSSDDSSDILALNSEEEEEEEGASFYGKKNRHDDRWRFGDRERMDPAAGKKRYFLFRKSIYPSHFLKLIVLDQFQVERPVL